LMHNEGSVVTSLTYTAQSHAKFTCGDHHYSPINASQLYITHFDQLLVNPTPQPVKPERTFTQAVHTPIMSLYQNTQPVDEIPRSFWNMPDFLAHLWETAIEIFAGLATYAALGEEI
jgi:hypothetical protein